MSLCREIELALSDYAAGDLPSPAAEMVTSHLTGCAACRKELAREMDMRSTFEDLPLLSCPARVTTRVLAKIDRPAQSPPRNLRNAIPRFRLFLLPAAAAATLLLIFLSPFPGPTGPGGESRTAAPVADAANPWTAAELDAARQDAVWSLRLTARLIERSERAAVGGVFGHQLPGAISETVRKIVTTNQGERG